MAQETTLTRYYAPSEILNIYKGKLTTEYYTNRQGQLRIYMQGIFIPGKGQVYQGYCFDCIKDASNNSYLSIKPHYFSSTSLVIVICLTGTK